MPAVCAFAGVRVAAGGSTVGPLAPPGQNDPAGCRGYRFQPDRAKRLTWPLLLRWACGRGSNQLRVKLLSVRAPPDHVKVWTSAEALVTPVGNPVTLTEYVAPDVRRPVVAK